MGNGKSSQQQEIEYCQRIEDPRFGEVDIFRTQDMLHIMKKEFTFLERDHNWEQLRKSLAFMQETRHSSLVTVHKVIHKEEKQVCIQYDRIEAYVQYYNFTLLNIVESGRRLSKGEFWFVLYCLADLGVVLEENGIDFSFEKDNVFVSLNGSPCVYLFMAGQTQGEVEGEEGEVTMGQSLGRMVLELSAPGQDKAVQMETLQKMDEGLFSTVIKMLDNQIGFQELHCQIDRWVLEGKAQLAKTLAVTKFMNQLKKQSIIHRSNNEPLQPPKQTQKEKQKQKQKQKQKPKQKEKPSSVNISVQLPSRFSAMDTLRNLDLKKKNNSEQKENMKKRMELLFGEKENIINKFSSVSGGNSVGNSASRPSLSSSQPIKPMRSSVMWRRKALELIKKER